MIAEPGGEFVFGQFTRGEGDKGYHQFGICRGQNMSVQNQKSFAYDGSSSFVSVNKRMVAGDSKRITCRQFAHVWITIKSQILGTRHGTVEQSSLTDPFATTMFSNLFSVRGYSYIKRNPNPLLLHVRFLFGKFAERALPLRHDFTGNLHLGIKVSVIWF
jgi:hypothetical protein